MKKLLLVGLVFLKLNSAYAQDPHFSQFVMVPQYVNPSLIGLSQSDWRAIFNFRQQWGNANTPFTTGMAAAEYKIIGRQPKYYESDENTNCLAVGAAFMYDQSMFGAFKSNYVMGTLAYKANLFEGHSIGIGFQGLYGHRRIDYSRLTFGEQFSSQGFDITLPSGETAFPSFKPYLSVNAGVVYNYQREYFNLTLGGSMYHINKPKQSFLSGPDKILPMRYVLHGSVEYKATPSMFIHLSSIYMEQALPAYFTVGGTLGYVLSKGDESNILYSGLWVREGDAIYPFLGMKINNLQIGLSYDITDSKQNQGPSNPRTIELSLVITSNSIGAGIPPCPR